MEEKIDYSFLKNSIGRKIQEKGQFEPCIMFYKIENNKLIYYDYCLINNFNKKHNIDSKKYMYCNLDFAYRVFKNKGKM